MPPGGASPAYKLKEPGGSAYSSWQIYTGPLFVSEGTTVRAKAIRYGYKTSPLTESRVPQS